jgi:hypothetical protein
MIYTENGAVPSELPTVAEAKKRILEDVPNILETEYPEDGVSELVDSDLPVYYSEIFYQWGKLPMEDVDTWQDDLLGSIGDGKLGIYDLMSADLWNFYRNVYDTALEEIKEEKAGE